MNEYIEVLTESLERAKKLETLIEWAVWGAWMQAVTSQWNGTGLSLGALSKAGRDMDREAVVAELQNLIAICEAES